MQMTDVIKNSDPASCVSVYPTRWKGLFLWLGSNNRSDYICIPALVPLPTLTCLCTVQIV